MSEPRGPSVADQLRDVRLLGACLTVLIAQCDLAEAEFERASKSCFTLEFKAFLASDQLTDEIRDALMQQREDETGFNRALEDRSDLAYAQVLALIDEILQLQAATPDVLALKASACLWERPASEVAGDGGRRAAAFLTQLAALQ